MLPGPWMNDPPAPQKTPLQIAQDEMRRWRHRVDDLTAQLDAARKAYADAIDRVLAIDKVR